MEKQCRACDNKTKWTGCQYSYNEPEHYDGVSEWVCQKCNTRYGRWTDKILKDGEVEPVFGEVRNG